ncbi:hypothetical protein [Rhizobium ruizarguesonis]|jgi:hypothetical protein|uniref:hypothetical protein n=1 Tax=Rhizobium ruizarguesonis TaxID=2081791 RepID=UPI001030C699|nr:hypothetical protein [Rhizobium ruizarguesonis]TBE99666.1 hypothetical protein ELG98_25335 [Rhizobium ruizarguesonis]
MARQSKAERNRKQKARQQEIRDGHKEAKRPSRDDIARMALYWMITRAIAHSSEERLEMMQERIVKLLVVQGFDEAASEAVFDDLVEKYRGGDWPFRRKVHFMDRPDDLDLDV